MIILTLLPPSRTKYQNDTTTAKRPPNSRTAKLVVVVRVAVAIADAEYLQIMGGVERVETEF